MNRVAGKTQFLLSSRGIFLIRKREVWCEMSCWVMHFLLSLRGTFLFKKREVLLKGLPKKVTFGP